MAMYLGITAVSRSNSLDFYIGLKEVGIYFPRLKSSHCMGKENRPGIGGVTLNSPSALFLYILPERKKEKSFSRLKVINKNF